MCGFDSYAVFEHLPEITGMELVRRYGKWIGPYYLNGERHPVRHDKLAFTLYNGTIVVHEQGGASMSLLRWMVEYGGSKDRADALLSLRLARRLPLVTDVRCGDESASGLVLDEGVYESSSRYGLDMCPLFRWMSRVFGRAQAESAFRRYRVTTDGSGLAVFWYTDLHGRLLHDKRVRYADDGHRDRTFGGTRRYRTSDGYTSRCYFGEHLLKGVSRCTVSVVESEKTAMVVWLRTGRLCVATGGKTQLRREEPWGDGVRRVLLPDLDARDEWSKRGEVEEWWKEWDDAPEHADIGDYIVKQIERNEEEELV